MNCRYDQLRDAIRKQRSWYLNWGSIEEDTDFKIFLIIYVCHGYAMTGIRVYILWRKS